MYRRIILAMAILSLLFFDSGLVYAADQDDQLKDLVGFWHSPRKPSFCIEDWVYELTLIKGGFKLKLLKTKPDPNCLMGVADTEYHKFDILVNGRDLTGTVTYYPHTTDRVVIENNHGRIIGKCEIPSTTFAIVSGRISQDWKTLVIVYKEMAYPIDGTCTAFESSNDVVLQLKPYNR
ncbi:MAG: hypothetical protein HZA13_09485 [Nitrospirae bacterium]|nr:hypothetical protein [Nitrospirota bacterium]